MNKFFIISTLGILTYAGASNAMFDPVKAKTLFFDISNLPGQIQSDYSLINQKVNEIIAEARAIRAIQDWSQRLKRTAANLPKIAEVLEILIGSKYVAPQAKTSQEAVENVLGVFSGKTQPKDIAGHAYPGLFRRFIEPVRVISPEHGNQLRDLLDKAQDILSNLDEIKKTLDDAAQQKAKTPGQ